MANDLYYWLDQIEKRPGMYLSDGGFAALNAFIMGHSLASPSCGEYPPFHQFHEWLLEKVRSRSLHISESDPLLSIEPSYPQLIRILAADDQTDAMQTFFKYLREYRHSG